MNPIRKPQDVTHVSLETFAQELNEALSGIYPRGRPYNHVLVLMITWSNTKDELQGLFDAMSTLEAMFKKYGFEVQEVTLAPRIPSKLGLRFISELNRHIAKLRPDSMVIVYYGGHGEWKKEGASQRLHFVPLFEGTQPSLNFSSTMELVFETLENDVLYIIDCCHAATAAIGSKKEVLAAAAPDELALNSPTGFTRQIAEALDNFYPSPHTVALLHAEIFDKYVPRGELSGSNVGMDVTPFHTVGKDQTHSFVIAPLHQQTPQAFQSMQPTDPALALPGPSILLTVHLEDGPTPMNLSQWRRWLGSQIPQFIKGVEVSSFHPGGSSLLVLTMPMAAYSLLARSGRAYRGIDYVWGPNALLPEANLSLGGLSICEENIKPGSSHGS